LKNSKKKKLETAGWKVGDAKDFLGLSASEMETINRMNKLYSQKIPGNDLVPKTNKARMKRILDRW